MPGQATTPNPPMKIPKFKLRPPRARDAIPSSSPAIPKNSPVNLLAAEHQRAQFAVIIAVGALLVAVGVLIYALMREPGQPRVFVIDTVGNITVGPLEPLTLQSPLFQTTALWATKAILERSPSGMNLPEIAEGVLTHAVLQRVRGEVQAEREHFRTRQIHQNPEINRIEALADREDDTRILRVTGQLIRAASFGGLDDSEAIPFILVLSLSPNPRLGQRGQYPFVVTDFLLQTQ